jgi:hypothetical protein
LVPEHQLRLLRRTTRQDRDKRFLTDAELNALHKQSPLVELGSSYQAQGLKLSKHFK